MWTIIKGSQETTLFSIDVDCRMIKLNFLRQIFPLRARTLPPSPPAGVSDLVRHLEPETSQA